MVPLINQGIPVNVVHYDLVSDVDMHIVMKTLEIILSVYFHVFLN